MLSTLKNYFVFDLIIYGDQKAPSSVRNAYLSFKKWVNYLRNG